MNIGPMEIILVLALALLVFGPSKLPSMGRQLGRGLREFKNAANTAKEELGLSGIVDEVNQVKDDITSAAGLDDIKETLSAVTSPIETAKKSVTSSLDDAKKAMGVEELAAGVGSVKSAMAFSPKNAAKGLLKSKPAADEEQKTDAASGDDAGAREPVAPAAEKAVVAEAPVAEEAVVAEAPAAAEVTVADEPLSAEDAEYLADDDGFTTVQPAATEA